MSPESVSDPPAPKPREGDVEPAGVNTAHVEVHLAAEKPPII